MSPIKQLFSLIFIWPIRRNIEMVKSLGKNSVRMGAAVKRGMTTDARKNAPVTAGMTTDEVMELDRWWKTLSEYDRKEIWAQHDAWVLKTMEEEEKQGRGVWSLTNDEVKREKALQRQALSYYAWLCILLGTSASFLITILLSPVTAFYVLMSLCFIAFILPTFLTLRVTRAQLLYGRRVTYKEFASFLPREMDTAIARPALPSPATSTPPALIAAGIKTEGSVDE